MKRVIVTGASSMLGVALIERLLREDIEVIYAVIRPQSQNKKRRRIPINERVKIVECELIKYYDLVNLIDEECDTFYHMAWPRTGTYREDLSDILLKCDAIKGVAYAVDVAGKLGCNKFIGVGSQSEYGVPKDGYYSTDMPCHPVRVDGTLHMAAGETARIMSEERGIRCFWVRVFSVYGVYDRDNSMISSTINKLLSKEHCSFTKSEQIWDFVNVDDVAEAFYLIGDKAKKGAVYNMASGTSRPLKEYLEIIRDIVDPNAILGIGELEYPQDPIMKMMVDISPLTRDIGWKPNISFEQGIREIYDYRAKKKSNENG